MYLETPTAYAAFPDDQFICDPSGPKTGHYEVNATDRTLVEDVQSGTIQDKVPCDPLPAYDWDAWAKEDFNYELRRKATPLLYLDIRSGIYVTEGREGGINDIYGLPSAFPDSNLMYPYTVQSGDYVFPPGGIPAYHRYQADWGLDFSLENSVYSPMPTWAVVKGFRPRSTDQQQPLNWKPLFEFIKTNETESFIQGSALNGGRYLINVFVELPTPGQETLQIVQLRDPPEDPLSLVNFPTATKIRNIGAI